MPSLILIFRPQTTGVVIKDETGHIQSEGIGYPSNHRRAMWTCFRTQQDPNIDPLRNITQAVPVNNNLPELALLYHLDSEYGVVIRGLTTLFGFVKTRLPIDGLTELAACERMPAEALEEFLLKESNRKPAEVLAFVQAA